ncbi:MAG: restriction endonuclease subunit S [Pirellulales bacterium]|nr:restriction endonuclease subunit S [Pirellulales bacterium]
MRISPGQHKTKELIDLGILTIGDGYRAKNSELASSGLPFARAGNVNGGFHFAECDFFPSTDLNKVGEKIARPGDAVFTSKGSVGRIAFVTADTPRFVYSPQLCYWRSNDPRTLYPRFLYYWLCGDEFADQANSVKGQTDMADYVSLTDQRRMSITLPEINVQVATAGLLGALDDKIELNRRTNETLEAMARSLFKSWFDQQPGSEITIGKLEADAVLAVNDGYRAKNSELGAPGLPFVRAGNLNGGGFDLAGSDLLAETRIGLAGMKLSQPGDVAFTSKGTVGRFAFVHKTTPKFVYSPQLCFWRSMKRDQLDPHVLFQWMKSDELSDQIDAVKGQTDMADYVSLRDQRRMKFTAPLGAAQVELGRRLEPLMDRVAANLQQSRTLVTLRDSLLPKLLSGEIRLRNAERKIKEVV